MAESSDINRIMDSVEWQRLPEPDDRTDDLPYPTHQGMLRLGEHELRCYTLNDGQRIIDGQDFEALFQEEGD